MKLSSKFKLVHQPPASKALSPSGKHFGGLQVQSSKFKAGAAFLSGFLLLLSTVYSFGQTVRVTTWDVQPIMGREKSAAAAIQKTAEQLKTLSPDVIVIRGISGWKMCSQMAEALKPAEYKVAVCSAFRSEGTTNFAPNQVGILARSGSYFMWAEPWKEKSAATLQGGFAFAALQVGGHRFGFWAVDLPKANQKATDESLKQWTEALITFRGWENNRLEGFVAAVSGSLPSGGETARLLRTCGFSDTLGGSGQRATNGAVEGHLVPNAEAPSGLLLSQWPMTCDFDFHPTPIVVVSGAAANAVRPSRQAFVALGTAVTFVLALIVLMLLGIRRRLSRLQAQSELLALGAGQSAAALPYNLAISAPALAEKTDNVPTPRLESQDPANGNGHYQAALRQGMFAHLAHWLKQAFVQRLLSDRKHLMETQEAATMKVLAVDERLARLELKIQEETSSYEKQIEQLNRELLTAREENLELIRGQIKLLKEEMEDARKRVMESEPV